jgi:SAM-dependent methyltransferase
MFLSTLRHLRCLNCQGQLEAHDCELSFNEHSRGDVVWGRVACAECAASYPILAGVLLYVTDVENALIQHIKGIGKLVPDDRIPAENLATFLEARESLAEDGFFEEGIEEDLEADRVNALYVMNHYIKALDVPRTGSDLLDGLIHSYWDHGPLEKTAAWIRKGGLKRVFELGSSVGGIAQRLAGSVEDYLGIDASFVSVALARHLALGASYPNALRIPGDLIDGPVSIEPRLPGAAWASSDRADFILGDLHSLAVVPGSFDVSVALGLIDMLDEPGVLVYRQLEALEPGGFAIQAGPYIWHEPVARALRERFPGLDSAGAVQALYQGGGFTPGESLDAVPWVFFKHRRQVELYSVHWAVNRLAP